MIPYILCFAFLVFCFYDFVNKLAATALIRSKHGAARVLFEGALAEERRDAPHDEEKER